MSGEQRADELPFKDIRERGAFHMKDEPNTALGGPVSLCEHTSPRGNLSFYQLSREVTAYLK